MALPSFQPRPGQLVTHFAIYEQGSLIRFCFNDKSEDPEHFQMIAVMRDFRAFADFGGYIFAGYDHTQDRTGSRTVEHRHLTTHAELKSIRRNWSSKNEIGFNAWLKRVLSIKGLSEFEKKRLEATFK